MPTPPPTLAAVELKVASAFSSMVTGTESLAPKLPKELDDGIPPEGSAGNCGPEGR